MKYVNITCFCISLFNLGHCFAMEECATPLKNPSAKVVKSQPKDDAEAFRIALIGSVVQITKITKKLNELEEEKYGDYFNDINSNTKELSAKINKARNKFAAVSKQINEFYKSMELGEQGFETLRKATDPKFIGARETQKEFLSKRLLPVYCESMPSVESLHAMLLEERAKSSNPSPYIQDLENMLVALHILPDHLSNHETLLAPFLSVYAKGSHKGEQKWRLIFDHPAFELDARRRAQYIINCINHLDFDQLPVPQDYKEALIRIMSETKKGLNAFLRKPFKFEKTDTLIPKNARLAIASPVFNYVPMIQQGFAIIDDPLNLKFSPGNIFLTKEEKGKYREFLPDFFNAKSESTDDTLKQNVDDEKEETKIEKPRRKGKNKNNPLLTHTKTQEEKQTSTPEPLLTSKEGKKEEEKEEKSDQLQPPASLLQEPNTPEEKIEQPAPVSCLSTNEEKEVVDEEAIQKQFQEDLESTHNWLNEIMRDLHTAKNIYLLQKAYRLQTTLKGNPLLLEEVREGVSSLAAFFSTIKSQTPSSSEAEKFCVVPKNAVYAFNRLIFTENRNLKDKIDFAFVSNLFRNLGGTIDNGRNGDRIHLELKGYHTSIHLHDKKKGILDSGRISSIREMIIKAGFRVID